MYSLFATKLDQVRDRPCACFNLRGHCWGHLNRTVNLAEVVIRKVEVDCSLKIFQLLAKFVCQAREAAPQFQRVNSGGFAN